MEKFICKICKSQVKPNRLVDSDGRAAWWYQCENRACLRCYGFPAYEHQLDFIGTLDVMHPGLEEWPDPDPLELTVAMQGRHINADEVKRYVKIGTVAASIALSLVTAILAPLLSHSSSFPVA